MCRIENGVGTGHSIFPATVEPETERPRRRDTLECDLKCLIDDRMESVDACHGDLTRITNLPDFYLVIIVDSLLESTKDGRVARHCTVLAYKILHQGVIFAA